MSKVRCFIEELNSSGVITATREYVPLKAYVSLDGTRAVDTAEFDFPISAIVKENFRIKYIQDIVDTESLRGLWNFQYNTRDESGYDFDGIDEGTGAHTSDFGHVNADFSKSSSQFRDLYCIRFDAAGEEVTISDDADIDFSGPFDIYIWYDADTTHFNAGLTEQIIFSKYDGATQGLEIGLKKDSGNWYGFARYIRSTDPSPIEITDTTTFGATSLPHLMRFMRDSDGNVKLFIDGTQVDTTDTGVTQTLDNSTDLTFGTGHLGTEDYSGLIHQIRIYCGTTLSDEQAATIKNSIPQPMTMKFMGRVWKQIDGTHKKVCKCKSESKLFPQISLNSGILDGTTFTNEVTARTKTVFENERADEIMHDIMLKISSTSDNDPLAITDYITVNTGSTGTAIVKYVASGNLLFNLELLASWDSDVFVTLPRRILVKEPLRTSRLQFDNGPYHVLEDSKDDSTTVNDLTVYNSNRVFSQEESFTATSGQTTFTLADFPLNVRAYDNSTFQDPQGAASVSYTVDFENKQVIFDTGRTSGNTILFEYDYEDTTTVSKRVTGSNIAEIGRYAKTLFIPQFTDPNNLNTIATRLTTDTDVGRQAINQRVKVVIPSLFNGVRPNWKVSVTNTNKGIDYTSGGDGEIPIKSVEFFYPEGKTILHCGEHQFNQFDLEKKDRNDIENINDSIVTTKNA